MRVVGINDDVTTCECCGKSDLKCTVVLASLDADGNPDGGVVHYGRQCAAMALLGKKTTSNTQHIERLGRAKQYARKWLGLSAKHNSAVVNNTISVRFNVKSWCSGPFSITFYDGDVVST